MHSRWKILIFAAVGIVVAVAGLSRFNFPAESALEQDPEAPSFRDESDPVTLTWWTFGGTGHENAIAAFEAENPNVTVEVTIGGFDEHHEKLVAALASGEVPDIALLEVGYSSLFKANPQNFRDLRDFGAGELEADFVPFRWEHGVAADGEVVGIPTDVGGLNVAYRVDLFEEAGLPTETDEVSDLITTWDGFLDLGDSYVDATGKPFIDSSGLLFESALKQGPEGFYQKDGTVAFDSQHVRDAWALAVEAVDRNQSANIPAFSPEWNTAMANGAYAVQLAPAWMMNYIADQAPETKGLWSIARFPGGGGNWGGSQLVIPADSANADLAWELIEFISTDEQQIQIFQDFGNFPSIADLYDTPEILEFKNPHFGETEVGSLYAESILTADPQFEGRDQRTFLREFTAALVEFENETLDANNAWEQAIENIELETG